MARPNPRSPDQPLAIRWFLKRLEAAASLKLAVLVIALSTVVLGWATFVEKWYGTNAVSFAIYRSWWFALLLALLGLNVFCAALIRLPWKRYQVGFLVTHAGILVLLIGCLMQRMAGVDAQMYVYEADSSHRAFSDAKHFRLTVASLDPLDAGAEPEVIDIPFRAGPFNWDDYSKHFFFPWKLVRRDQGVIYDRDGIKLEVLDYYADSRREPIPRLELEISSHSPAPAEEAMDFELPPERLSLAVIEASGVRHADSLPFGRGQQEKTDSGLVVTFWMTGLEAETEAFLHSAPKAPLGPIGQVVLYVGGKTYHLPVEEFGKNPVVPLGDSGIEVRMLKFSRRPWGVHLEIRPKDGRPGEMRLYADHPNANVQDRRNHVYGTYWFQPPQSPKGGDPNDPHAAPMRRGSAPRVDVLLGHDQRLYYRQWNAPELTQTGPWPTGGEGPSEVDGTQLVAFPDSSAQTTLTVARLIGSALPTTRVVPLPFETAKQKKAKGEVKAPRIRVRLSVDDHSGEFWLRPWFPVNPLAAGEEQGTVVGDDRRVEVVATNDEIDLGFQIYLHDFTRKLDPGASMSSHYSSLVDVMDLADPPRVLQEKVLITMNEPLTATDPKSGRAYRVYQEAYVFVGKPGDPRFDGHVYRAKQIFDPVQRDDLYYSVLTVNFDPGRGFKYVGCLLIIAGIATMFYMRAYFFRR